MINFYRKYFLVVFVLLFSCNERSNLNNLKNEKKSIAEQYQEEFSPEQDDYSKDNSITETIVAAKDSAKRITRILPPWVKVKMAKEKIKLSDSEIKSFCQLDFNNDKQIDIVFVRNQGLMIFQKKKKTKVLNKIYNLEGRVLNDFDWIDYFYIDDNTEIKNYDKNISVIGQVLNLVKESSGLVSIYHDSEGFKWLSFD